MRLSYLGYRQRFLLGSLFLSLIFFYGLSLRDYYSRLYFLPFLFFLTFITFGLIFWHHRHLVGYWLLAFVPAYILGGSLMFELVLPSLVWLHLLEAIMVFIFLYASFLDSNIFLVSSQRTIKLFQAALGISLFLVIVGCFLVMDAVLVFRFSAWLNALLTFILVFPISLYLIWIVDLSDSFKKIYWYYAFILTLLVSEGSLVISFWPTPLTVKAIFVASLVYALGGLYQAHFLEKVFKQTENELWWLMLLITGSVFLVTRWGGG